MVPVKVGMRMQPICFEVKAGMCLPQSISIVAWKKMRCFEEVMTTAVKLSGHLLSEAARRTEEESGRKGRGEGKAAAMLNEWKCLTYSSKWSGICSTLRKEGTKQLCVENSEKRISSEK